MFGRKPFATGWGAFAHSWLGLESTMKRDQSEPPTWFVLAVSIGAVLVGAIAALVIAFGMG